MSRTPKPPDFLPVKEFPAGHAHIGKARCQAWSMNRGRQCLGLAVRGRRVCRFHGGSTKAGIASGTFKTGKYSKYLPTRMAERYQESLNDRKLLDLKEEIRVINTRIADLMGRVDMGEAGAIWRLARSSFNDLRNAIIEEDKNKIRISLGSLDTLLGRGVADYQAWDEINDQFELLRKMIDGQQKLELRKMLYVSVDEALGMQKSLIEAVIKHVNDADTLNKIQKEWMVLENRNTIDAEFSDLEEI